VLRKLDIRGRVDVLGLSWGGGARPTVRVSVSNARCRALILVSTGTGVVMVPGRPRGAAENADTTPVSWTTTTPRASPPKLYGGSARTHSEVVERLLDRQLMAGSRIG